MVRFIVSSAQTKNPYFRYSMQAFYRGWCVRRAVKRTKAALLIQARYRSLVKSKRAHERFHLVKASALTIQAVYRGWKCRQLVDRNRAAIIIQTAFRRFLCKRRDEVSQSIGNNSYCTYIFLKKTFGY